MNIQRLQQKVYQNTEGFLGRWKRNDRVYIPSRFIGRNRILGNATSPLIDFDAWEREKNIIIMVVICTNTLI